MTYLDFSILLEAEMHKYILCLCISILIYFILFRKKIISIFDPFTLAVFGSMMGFTIVLFLKYTDYISNFYLVQYLATQGMFFLGFFLFNTKKEDLNGSNLRLNINKRYFYLLIIFSSIYFLANIYIYLIAGIPLFSPSRLDSVAIGGGFGFIRRIVSIYGPVTLYFLFYCLLSHDKSFVIKAICYIILFLYAIVAFLSGSKSSLFGIISFLFLFLLINREYFGKTLRGLQKKQIYIFGIAFIIAIIITMVHDSQDFEEGFFAILFRIASYGDTYYMAYVNENIKYLTETNPISFFFGDLLRTIRILPENMSPPGTGFEIAQLATGSDIMGGPNPRHNVVGYIHFGLTGSLIFSFFCGLSLNIIRRLIFKANKSLTQDRKLFVLLFYLCFVKVEMDPPATFSNLSNIILFIPIVLILNNIFMRMDRLSGKRLNKENI